MMVGTTESLMTCGFRVLYAYTESDEISLLFDPEEQLFGRKLQKYNSTLAGEASAQFSLKLGQPACFDCRISQLPTTELVVDYFRWRNGDAARNALRLCFVAVSSAVESTFVQDAHFECDVCNSQLPRKWSFQLNHAPDDLHRTQTSH